MIDPEGRLYPSLVAAAKATRTPVSTIGTRLILGTSGWRYADEDIPASPTEQR